MLEERGDGNALMLCSEIDSQRKIHAMKRGAPRDPWTANYCKSQTKLETFPVLACTHCSAVYPLETDSGRVVTRPARTAAYGGVGERLMLQVGFCRRHGWKIPGQNAYASRPASLFSSRRKRSANDGRYSQLLNSVILNTKLHDEEIS
jgi:hypothetical protein